MQSPKPAPGRRIRIQCPNAIGFGTKVTDADTGEAITGITEARIVIRADDIVRASLDIYPSEIDVIAHETPPRQDVWIVMVMGEPAHVCTSWEVADKFYRMYRDADTDAGWTRLAIEDHFEVDEAAR